MSVDAALTPAVWLSLADWFDLLVHYAMLSLVAVGGAITTVPEMHRYLVTQQGWLNDAQFSASIAIAQAAPGPNILFVALLGWNVGLNAGGGLNPQGLALGALGLCVTMLGIMLPSSVLTCVSTRWMHKNRERRSVRAFKQGMAPIVIGLLLATAWTLSRAQGQNWGDWPWWVISLVSALVVWRTRLHLLWLLGAGAIVGMALSTLP